MTGTTAPIEPRDAACQLLGHIILRLGEMAYHLGACLHQRAATPEFETFAPIIDTMMLKQKLDILNDMVAVRFAGTPACLDGFARWHGRLGRLRLRCSGFVHGHGDDDIDALRPARTRGYARAVCDIAELREACRRADELGDAFRSWRERWLV
jgi:hypothetical protein